MKFSQLIDNENANMKISCSAELGMKKCFIALEPDFGKP